MSSIRVPVSLLSPPGEWYYPSYKFGFSSSYNALGVVVLFSNRHFIFAMLPSSTLGVWCIPVHFYSSYWRMHFEVNSKCTTWQVCGCGEEGFQNVVCDFRHQFPFTFGVVLPRGNFFQIILVKSREFYNFTDRLERRRDGQAYICQSPRWEYIYAVSSVETFNPPLKHSSWVLENDCVQIFRIQILI